MQTGDNQNSKEQLFYLKDLLDLNQWQKIQDNFSAVTNVGLRTLDNGCKLFTSASHEPRLCSELLKKSQVKNKVCGTCLPTFLGGKEVVNKNLSFICHAGLHNFISPLKVQNRILGYVIVGPVVLGMRKSKQQYNEAAEELNLDLEEFWGAILEIKVISFQGVQSLIELIKDIAEHTLELSYQNVNRRQMMFKPDPFTLGKLLNALLDVACQVSGADIGSVMTLNNRDELRIQTSRGLTDTIIRSTRVKVGEGISGIAVKEGEPLLIIDHNTENNRLKHYLKRPQISSSMVIPFKVKNSVVGVINLGTLRTSAVRFNAGNLDLVNKLIDLATVALK